MNTITLTSKGQITLPIEFRRALNIADGDQLAVTYVATSQSLILRKPLTVDQLSQKVAGFIKKTTPPVTDVDQYYQQHRDDND